MAQQRFWRIIDAARGTTNPTAPSARPSALKRELQALSDSDIAAFAVRYSDEMVELDRWDVWDAGYAAAQGMADDDFHYFRSWLIGKGQVVVAQAESNPEGLAEDFSPADWSGDELENESLEYVTNELLAEHNGRNAADDFSARISSHEDDQPSGKRKPEKTIDARYPLMAAWAARFEH